VQSTGAVFETARDMTHCASCLRLSLVHLATTDRTVMLDGSVMLRICAPFTKRIGAAVNAVPFCTIYRNDEQVKDRQNEEATQTVPMTYERMVKGGVFEGQTAGQVSERHIER